MTSFICFQKALGREALVNDVGECDVFLGQMIQHFPCQDGVANLNAVQVLKLVTSGGAYAYRLVAEIIMKDTADKPVLTWKLEKAIPIKFKAADLNAKGTEIGIEELHLAHEGLQLIFPAAGQQATGQST